MSTNSTDRTPVNPEHRDAVLYGLTRALDDGKLSAEEHAQRSITSQSTMFEDELLPIISDLDFGDTLPAAMSPQILPALSATQRQAAPAPAVEYHPGTRNSGPYFLFGGNNKREGWTSGAKHTIAGMLGGTHVDYSLARPVTEINVYTGPWVAQRLLCQKPTASTPTFFHYWPVSPSRMIQASQRG